MKRNKVLKVIGIALLGAVAVTSINPVVKANAAWKEDSTGWWYAFGNSYATGWKQISDEWYYFDSDGYMKTGWVKDNGAWYYLESSGEMKKGWLDDNGKWYYLNDSGEMQTGWFNDGGETYYLTDSGEMAEGWYAMGNDNYYFGSNGSEAFGKVNIDNSLYYFNSKTGALVKNFDSKYVTTDKNGIITKFEADAVKKEILANDSEYFKKCKESQYVDDMYLMEPDLSNISNFFGRTGAAYNIENEDCLVFYCMTNHNDYENLKCIYLVGLKSGKIYCSDSHGHKEVYEIKDNKTVNKYTDVQSNYVENWR